jgi:hypothetical protein
MFILKLVKMLVNIDRLSGGADAEQGAAMEVALAELDSLRAAGQLTDEEYTTRRAEIISRS